MRFRGPVFTLVGLFCAACGGNESTLGKGSRDAETLADGAGAGGRPWPMESGVEGAAGAGGVSGGGDGSDAPTCNPTLSCGQTMTCVKGFLYPTTCGPANCDLPRGPCPGADSGADVDSGAHSDSAATTDATAEADAGWVCPPGEAVRFITPCPQGHCFDGQPTACFVTENCEGGGCTITCHMAFVCQITDCTKGNCTVNCNGAPDCTCTGGSPCTVNP